jgi:hypothetical protein
MPIHTLHLPFTRIYVINGADLVPAMQKEWRLLSFAFFTTQAGSGVGMSKSSIEVMKTDLAKDHGFAISWPVQIKPLMGPGETLDVINRNAVAILSADVAKLQAGGPTTLRFWDWTRELLFTATTEAVFGPMNPYRDAGVKKAWR